MSQPPQPEYRHATDPANPERRIAEDLAIEVRAAADGHPAVIRGYAAVFNRESVVLSALVKGQVRKFRETILPGAFDGAGTTRTESRLNHDRNVLLAMRPDTLRMGTDERGLWYEFDYDANDPDHQRVMSKINRGEIRTSSFGFTVAPGGDRWDNSQEIWKRTISKVGEVIDVSPVTGYNAAYPDTSVAARCIGDMDEQLEAAKQADRDIELRNVELRIYLAQFPG